MPLGRTGDYIQAWRLGFFAFLLLDIKIQVEKRRNSARIVPDRFKNIMKIRIREACGGKIYHHHHHS